METNFDRDFRAIVAAIVSRQPKYGDDDEAKIIEQAVSLAGEMERARIKRQQADIQRAAQHYNNPYGGWSGLNQNNNYNGLRNT